MRTRLIYNYMVSGHNMEYLHHLYIGALEDECHKYVFAVPREFEEKKSMMEWKQSDRIRFHFIDDHRHDKMSLLTEAWHNGKLLDKVVRETKADEVILISLIDFIPFMPLFIPKGVRVSGIIYRIYLYFLDEMSRIQKLQEWIKYKVITMSRCIDRVFILNDQESASKLNLLWKTNKYEYLPDPFIPFDRSQLRDMRQELGIADDKIIVLHIGSITYGKGSDRIFDMITNSEKEELKRYCFVFAGVVADNIKEDFYKRLAQCREKADIIVRDEYLSYEDMGSLVYTADKVVLPYRRIGQSSGIIAYCAQMGTPVFVPSQGLICKLAKDYSIGIGIDYFNDIHSIEKDVIVSDEYCKCHNIESFYKTILTTGR